MDKRITFALEESRAWGNLPVVVWFNACSYVLVENTVLGRTQEVQTIISEISSRKTKVCFGIARENNARSLGDSFD